jgi:hypothetical protein
VVLALSRLVGQQQAAVGAEEAVVMLIFGFQLLWCLLRWL